MFWFKSKVDGHRSSVELVYRNCWTWLGLNFTVLGNEQSRAGTPEILKTSRGQNIILIFQDRPLLPKIPATFSPMVVHFRKTIYFQIFLKAVQYHFWTIFPFQDCPLPLFRTFIFWTRFVVRTSLTSNNSVDYITIVPNLGINLRIMFSENVIDDDLWFELFMIVKI